MITTKTFDSLSGFVMHLAAAELAVRAAEHSALKKAAVLIENTAKGEIGVYQPEIGPFPAWAPLADSTMQDRINKGFTPNDPELRSGELRASIGHEVAGREAVVGSTSDVMVYQELGTSKMPSRPILGPAAFTNREKVCKLIGAHVVAAILLGREVPGGPEYFYDK